MKNKSRKGKPRKTINVLSLLVLFSAFLFYMSPFIMLMINSFKSNRDIMSNPFSLSGQSGFTLDNYTTAFEQMNFARAFANSLIVTGTATVLVVLLASMTAYYIVRNPNMLSKVVFALMIAAMIIPFQALMIPLVSIYGAQLNLLNSRATLIFMHVGFAMSMSVFMFQGFIRSSIPISLEKAASIDGCNRLQIFFYIVFPLMKPIASTMVILNVLAFWNDYLLPSLVLSDRALLTLPLSTYAFYGTFSADYGAIMGGLVLSILPILVAFLFLQKYIISGVMSGAVK